MNATQTTLPSIPATELNSQFPNGCSLIDVREPVEHAEEHIQGATLIPLGELVLRASEIDRTQPCVVMCQSGKRGADALKKLRSMGFENIRNLEGGMLAWKSAGLPVNQPEKKRLPLMQQVQLTIGLGVITGVVLSRVVDPNWVYLSAFFGAGLVFAGSTGWCGLAMLMSKMPWNKVSGQSCSASGNCSTSI